MTQTRKDLEDIREGAALCTLTDIDAALKARYLEDSIRRGLADTASQTGIEAVSKRLNIAIRRPELEALAEEAAAFAKELEARTAAKPKAGPKINYLEGKTLKELLGFLAGLEAEGKIEHLTDNEIGQLFTIRGKPVNAPSLKTIRNG